MQTPIKPSIDQTIQTVTPQINALETAFAAYYQLHCFDPDDVQTLFKLVSVELQKPTELVDSSLIIEFLVFHREKIKASLVGHLYKMLARDYVDANECAKSRDGSLLIDPSGEESNYIELKLKEALSISDDEAKSVQEHLMDAMLSAKNRAQLFVGMGDAYLIHFGREAEALEFYQKAFAEDASFQDAVERIFAVAEHLGQWDTALSALETLKVVQAEYFVSYQCKKAWILGKQGMHDKASEIYQSILDENPLYLDIFVRLVNEMLALQDMDGIKKRFLALMDYSRNAKDMTPVARLAYELGLGKICLMNLRSIPAAVRVYRSASTIAPENIYIHEILSVLYEADGDIEKSLGELHEITNYSPDSQNVLLKLATKYRSLGRFDESLCCYRFLDLMGCKDEECRNIVAKFGDLGLPEIHERLNEDLWQLIIPETLDGYLVRLLKLCAKFAGDLFANEYSTYKVHPKNSRLDMTAETAFNRVIRSETDALGFAEVPYIFLCDQFSGVTNAYFTDRSFLVHPNCLTGRSVQEIAFMTAKALMLMRPEYYLLQQGIANVELILRAIIKTIRPNIDIDLDKNQEQVAKTLAKSISNEQRSALAEIIDEMEARTPHYDTLLFFESAEEFANRVGLLFCDDPSIIGKLLDEEAKPISVRTTDERIRSLMFWGTSEAYFKLRKKLNIALKA